MLLWLSPVQTIVSMSGVGKDRLWRRVRSSPPITVIVSCAGVVRMKVAVHVSQRAMVGSVLGSAIEPLQVRAPVGRVDLAVDNGVGVVVSCMLPVCLRGCGCHRSRNQKCYSCHGNFGCGHRISFDAYQLGSHG